jgi:hypothetical protein
LRTINHSPAYVLQIKKQWRVVVPVRGKLTPRICPEEFSTQAAAEAWLQSDEGARAVEAQRRRGVGQRTQSDSSESKAA